MRRLVTAMIFAVVGRFRWVSDEPAPPPCSGNQGIVAYLFSIDSLKPKSYTVFRLFESNKWLR
ncbi:hypothetical protein, partial [Psychrobacillus soli]|uniref:hypothetical protein n=1 Tax=Psychrobacillus soli TaxID=1543965 RepID=UPI001C8E86F7